MNKRLVETFYLNYKINLFSIVRFSSEFSGTIKSIAQSNKVVGSETFSNLVRTRRSCRDFESTAVDKELLSKILNDAKWAPSW